MDEELPSSNRLTAAFCPVTGLPDFPAMDPGATLDVLRQLLGRYRQGVEQYLAQDLPADWSFVQAETDWSEEISRLWSPLSHLNMVADTETLRAAYNQGLELLTEHGNWRQQHPGIFRIYHGLKTSAGFARLSPEQQRIVELEIRDFHLAGVDLEPDVQADYRDIVMAISRLGTRFQENVLDATRAWTLPVADVTELAGLPEAELRLLAANARARDLDGWLIDLSDPSYMAILTHAENRDLRRQVYTAFVTRASDQGPHAGEWDNTPVIDELLSLRHRLAGVLGFGHYADYALSTRMADSPERVMTFLSGLAERAVAPAREQYAELSRFAASQGAAVPLEPWDNTFWAERYRQAELHLSDEALKPYFPLESMLGALFHVASRVFGISLEVDESVPVWHRDIRFYWVHDTEGERSAGLYLDLFARQHKRGGAWMDVCRSRYGEGAGKQIPIAYLNCNFPAPSDGHPSLLTHHDVQTLFHEFGHGLHHMLTAVSWPQINGISNVEWDAVELPSQLLESWCWEEHLLDGFTRHYRTGEALPEDLKQRLLKSRHFHKAMTLMRQLEFALTDFRLHLEYDPEQPRSPLAVLREVRETCSVVRVPEWNRFLHGFSHIFGGGYSAGYYSYLWAEQLAADAWERFIDEGPFNPVTGRALREEIYAVGASRPALDSFIAFRGRPPEPGPLLRSYGLESAG